MWLDRDKQTYEKWLSLMHRSDLVEGEEVDYTVGIFDGDTLAATGSYHRNIIKYLVVCEPYQAGNLLAKILNHLLEQMRSDGYSQFFVYTKPTNAIIFKSLGFKSVIEIDELLFMELGTPNFSHYLDFLQDHKQSGRGSAIVMNANPFTKGHQYLVEIAAQSSDQVYIFVLSEDRSEFSTADRMAMVKLGINHLENVTVLPTRDYMVSSAIFPSYFLKEKAQMTLAKTQATLDATLFKMRIAPVLDIKTRFVGEEPFSPVTDVYNQAMQTVFADELALKIIPRLAVNDQTISATRVREAIKEQNKSLLLEFLPETTYQYLKNYREYHK